MSLELLTDGKDWKLSSLFKLKKKLEDMYEYFEYDNLVKVGLVNEISCEGGGCIVISPDNSVEESKTKKAKCYLVVGNTKYKLVKGPDEYYFPSKKNYIKKNYHNSLLIDITLKDIQELETRFQSVVNLKFPSLDYSQKFVNLVALGYGMQVTFVENPE